MTLESVNPQVDDGHRGGVGGQGGPVLWDVEEYLWALRGAGRAAGTVRLRGYQLTAFARAHPRGPGSVTAGQVAQYLARWASPETLKSQRAAIHGYYVWAVRGGRLAADPTVVLLPVRVPRPLPRPAPPRAVAAAAAAADPDVQLMIALAATGGLRRAEIAAVRGDALNGAGLRVVGKGGQARLVVLPEPVAAAVAARGPGWTFPGRRGHAAADTVGRKVSAALGPGYTCHQLRHGFATAAYAAGGDLRAVQELLGHRSPTTTARYVAVPDQAMVAAAAGAARAYAAVV